MTLGLGSRYVLVDGAEKLKDADVKQLAPALTALPADTVVLLILRGKVSKGKGPAGARLVKAVEKAGGEVHLCAAPTAAAMPGWVAQRADELGVTIGRDAASLLVERVGANPQRLMRELEKLVSYVSDSGRIEPDDIEAVGALDVDVRAYQLGDAIIARDQKRAMLIADELRSSGEDLMPILFAIRRKLRDTRTAWAMTNAGRPLQEVQAELGAPPWIAKRVVAEARNADGDQIELAIGLLAQLDYAIRGGIDTEPWTALTLALEQMTATHAEPAPA
jgi:DNA polymerase-3 subunit delta